MDKVVMAKYLNEVKIINGFGKVRFSTELKNNLNKWR